MIKIRCEVPVLQINGRDVDANAKEKPVFIIESNLLRASGTNPITVEIAGVKYTIEAHDMSNALANVSNR